MFYFDKHNPNVEFCDNRSVDEVLCDGRRLVIEPDHMCDFTDLPYPDGVFHLVVFDPPHLDIGAGWQVEKYGKLDGDWRSQLTKGFSECFRVLALDGVLVFKWYEYRIPLKEVLACTPQEPVFGNRKPSHSKTHWLVFYKEGVRMTHRLKIRRCFADAVVDGRKTFEVRYDDRGYAVGDLVGFTVIEGGDDVVHPIDGMLFEISYILKRWGLKPGYVVFSIRPLEKGNSDE